LHKAEQSEREAKTVAAVTTSHEKGISTVSLMVRVPDLEPGGFWAHIWSELVLFPGVPELDTRPYISVQEISKIGNVPKFGNTAFPNSEALTEFGNLNF
jgi:hypothetical protein